MASQAPPTGPAVPGTIRDGWLLDPRTNRWVPYSPPESRSTWDRISRKVDRFVNKDPLGKGLSNIAQWNPLLDLSDTGESLLSAGKNLSRGNLGQGGTDLGWAAASALGIGSPGRVSHLRPQQQALPLPAGAGKAPAPPQAPVGRPTVVNEGGVGGNWGTPPPPVPATGQLNLPLDAAAETRNAGLLDRLDQIDQRATRSADQQYSLKDWYNGNPEGDIADGIIVPSKMSDNSLFGPGFYMSENPEIASGYANPHGKYGMTGVPGQSKAKTHTQIMTKEQMDIQKAERPNSISHWKTKEVIPVGDARNTTGKPIFVRQVSEEYYQGTVNQYRTRVKNALDLDKRYDSIQVRDILTKMGATPATINNFAEQAKGKRIGGDRLWQVATDTLATNGVDPATAKRMVNKNLLKNGVDAMTHTGGDRMGALVDGPKHQVLIVLDPTVIRQPRADFDPKKMGGTDVSG